MGFPHTSFSRKGSKVFAKSTAHQYSARKIDKLALFLEKNQKCMLYRFNRVSKPRDLERVPGHDTRLLLLFRKGPRRETQNHRETRLRHPERQLALSAGKTVGLKLYTVLLIALFFCHWNAQLSANEFSCGPSKFSSEAGEDAWSIIRVNWGWWKCW